MTNLIIIFTIIGGLILFALQNLSPSLSLMFFGLQSSALPLSVWIVIAIAAGFFSAIVISSLFQLSQSLAEPEVRSSSPRPSSPKPPTQANRDFDDEEAEVFDEPKNSQWQVDSAPVTEPIEPRQSRNKTSLAEDWETDVQPLNPSWSSQQQPTQPTQPTPSPRGFNLEKEDIDSSPATTDDFEDEEEDWVEEDWVEDEPPTYEAEQTPKTESWSGSVYSYGYRDTGESGVGKSESVYDADYRVIVPPQNTQIQSDDDLNPNEDEIEDWEEEDEREDTPDLGKS